MDLSHSFCAEVCAGWGSKSGPKNNLGGPKQNKKETKSALLLLKLNWMFLLKSWNTQKLRFVRHGSLRDL